MGSENSGNVELLGEGVQMGLEHSQRSDSTGHSQLPKQLEAQF